MWANSCGSLRLSDPAHPTNVRDTFLTFDNAAVNLRGYG
jgi:hypothetical protein